MKDGNWVPLSKAAVTELPTDRPYSKIEALFSMQVDYDNRQEVSISGYAKLWSWSRSKVKKLMETTGIEIEYPINTRQLQNQKGVIKFAPKKRQIRKQIQKQIRFFDSKAFGDTKNRSENRSKDTTKEPIKPKDLLSANSFDVFWKEYPKKKKKKDSLKAWEKIKPSEQLQQQILTSLQKQKLSPEWKKDNGQFIPYPASWLNGERWNDEANTQTSKFSM